MSRIPPSEQIRREIAALLAGEREADEPRSTLIRRARLLNGQQALRLLDRWLVWARRSQIPQFVRLARSITDEREAIRATLIHRQSQGRVEAMHTNIRLIARTACSFHSPDSLTALAILKLGGLTPSLPERAT